MGFLMPLLALGVGLIVVPWWVHRIRRPEREVVPFSSLMFVPEVNHEVIERRRVQHPLLMLLRMALLVLLALAFTRPYWTVLLPADTSESATGLHVILLDTSLSMQTEGWLEEAKQHAQAMVDKLPTEDRVAVMTLGHSARPVVPLFDPERSPAENHSDARRAIQQVQATLERTDYEAGLQAAEQLLMERSEPNIRRMVRLISDFQATGMPDATGWRLSPEIELESTVVGLGEPVNYGVQALAVQRVGEDKLQIRAQVKNWSGNTNRPVPVDLTIGDKVMDSNTLSVLPGHASQVRFVLDWDGKASVGGYIGLPSDSLAADNRRYFSWNPPHRSQVAVVQENRADERWPYHHLIQAALPASPDLPWVLTTVSEERLDLSATEMVIAGEPPHAASFRHYLEGGGKSLLVLHRGTQPGTLEELLAGTGIAIQGQRFAQTTANRFEPIDWVDLEHRVFHPFRGERFNDFSAIRYHNYFGLRVEKPSSVIARFANGEPAMLDIAIGEGRLILWTGGVESSWSNLAKQPRFLPLLQETLTYLAGDRPDVTDYTVGDAIDRVLTDHRLTGDTQVSLVHSAQAPRNAPILDQPGLLQWQTPSGQRQMAAVNVAPEESDPAPIDVSEFAIRLSDAPVLPQTQAKRADIADSRDSIIRREYGLWLVGCVLVLLILESGYAAWLAQRTERKS